MDYNIHLPEELKILSKPKVKIRNNTIIIYNGPFWDDWFFEAFIFLIILYMTLIQKLDLNNSYVIWFLVILFIYSFYCFSLNKVSIDFIEKKVTVVSYNPFINIYRKLIQVPFSIRFNDIDKLYSDWKYVGKGPDKYFTVLQTDSPYKFRIAIFAKEGQSIIFTDYLNTILKPNSVHAAEGSDTTMLN